MVQIAVTPDARWQATPLELISATGEAGFDALGVSAASVDQATTGAMQDAGLRCHEVLALVLGEDERATLDAAEQLAEAARLVGADWVLTVFRSGLDAATSRTVRRCAELFGDASAAMAVEFSPFGPATNIRAGMDIVEVANGGAGRAGLMIDSWHFSHGDSTWHDLATVPLEHIAYVQFADALAAETDDLMQETMERRAVPGEGLLPLRRFVATLLDRGWDGTVSAEVLSADLRQLPIEEVLSRLHDALVDFWRG